MSKHTIQSFPAVVMATCNAFRMGMEGQGSEHMIQLMDIMIQLTECMSPETITLLTPLIGETLEAIERKDYLWASDLLEYEISPFFLANSKLESIQLQINQQK